MITQSRLKELLKYNSKTGTFTRLVSVGNIRKGNIAGCKYLNGYVHIRVDKILFRAHRLVFLYINGEFPPNEVDHINGVRDDNRFDNLRFSNPSINARNHKMDVRNTSGITGVCWYKTPNCFRTTIYVNCKRVCLGYFDNIFDAACARKSAEQKDGYTSRNRNKQGHLPD